MSKTREIIDGEEYLFDPETDIERIICCDCGLTHDVKYRITDEGKVGVTVWRNNRATGQNRRYIDRGI